MTDAQTKTDKVYSWETGMPTKPDVDALLKYWPEPKVGDVMTYEDVSVLIGCDQTTKRFRSVTNAWRQRLQDRSVIVRCRSGKEFYVASADQVSAMTYDEIAGIGRKAYRHRKRLSAVSAETEHQREILAHQGRLMHAIEQDTKKKRMNILPNIKPDDMPRIGPPSPPPSMRTTMEKNALNAECSVA